MSEASRVLFFARNTVAHPSPGGMETSFAALAGALRGAGCRLALVTTRGWRHSSEFADAFDDVWVLPKTSVGRYSHQWWRATGNPGPWDAWDPSIAIGVGDAAGSFSLRDPRVPLVVQCHGTPRMEMLSALSAGGPRGAARAMLNLARQPSRRRLFRAAEEIWAVSPPIVDEIGRLRGRRGDVVFVPNIVDEDAFGLDSQARALARRGLGIAPAETVGLFLGRLDAQKGVHIAIAAMAEERSPLDRLLVAGDGPENRQLAALAGRLRLDHRVVFLGQIGRQDVARLLCASDVLLLPSLRREGLPMVILEAAASGLPIVASETAGVPADITESGCVQVVGKPNPRVINLGVEGALSGASERVSYLPERYSSMAVMRSIDSRLQRVASRRAVPKAGGDA